MPRTTPSGANPRTPAGSLSGSWALLTAVGAVRHGPVGTRGAGPAAGSGGGSAAGPAGPGSAPVPSPPPGSPGSSDLRRTLGSAARQAARRALAFFGPARRTPRAASASPGDRPDVRWLERVLSGLEEGIVVADASGRLRPVNPAARRILGSRSPADSATGWQPEGTLCGGDGWAPLPTDRHPVARALRGESVEAEPHLLRRTTGSEGTWVGVSARPLRDDADRTVGALLVVRDLTEQRRSEADLQRLSSAVAQTADAVLIADRHGRVLYANPAFEALTGLLRDDLLARPPHEALTELHEPGVYDAIRATLLLGGPYRGTVVHRTRLGRTYAADETATPVKDGSGRVTHLVLVARDASERRRLEERGISMRLAAQVQQRLYPAKAPCIPGLDVAGSVVPAEETCGDCYDYLEAPDGTVAIAVGDVSGHGLGSALIMAQTRAYLRAAVGSPGEPWEVLRNVNVHLCRDLPENQFVTLLLVAIDPRKGRLTYASAGHVAGLLLDGAGALKARLPASGPPLGILRDAAYPATEPVALEPGDSLVLVTDGVTECRSPLGDEFDEEGVLVLARANASATATEFLAALHERLRAFRAGAPPRDDITAVVCRVAACDAAGAAPDLGAA